MENKVNEVLKIMNHELNDTYTPILPSLLWSFSALDIDLDKEFADKAFNITLSNYNKLSYASKVLLS